MSCKNWIHETKQLVEIFHHCTGMIIAGLTPNGKLIASAGASEEVFQKLQQTAILAHDCDDIHLHQLGQFITISFNRDNFDQGYLLIGPFSDNEVYSLNQRSLMITPYLVRLIRFIQDHKLTNCCFSNTTEVCCLHVQRALNFICEHYHQPITLKQIAHKLGLNESYLSSLFRIETGYTFCQWLNKVRIEQSKDYLKHTEKPIAIIAIDVGYTNQSYYSAIFKKHVGVTPNSFRNKYRSIATS